MQSLLQEATNFVTATQMRFTTHLVIEKEDSKSGDTTNKSNWAKNLHWSDDLFVTSVMILKQTRSWHEQSTAT
jgi:hypothetical protein